VAIGTVLTAFNTPPGSPRYRKLARFTEAFFSRFRSVHGTVPPRQMGGGQSGRRRGRWAAVRPAQDWLDRTRTAQAGDQFDTFKHDVLGAGVDPDKDSPRRNGTSLIGQLSTGPERQSDERDTTMTLLFKCGAGLFATADAARVPVWARVPSTRRRRGSSRSTRLGKDDQATAPAAQGRMIRDGDVDPSTSAIDRGMPSV